MMMRLLEKIGSFVLERFEWVGSVILLLAAAVKEMRRPLRFRHIFAQMSHLGVDSCRSRMSSSALARSRRSAAS